TSAMDHCAEIAKLGRGIDGTLHLCLVGHVRSHKLGRRADFLGDCCPVRGRQVDDYDLRAFRNESLGAGTAEAGCAPGDECDNAFDVHSRRSLNCILTGWWAYLSPGRK